MRCQLHAPSFFFLPRRHFTLFRCFTLRQSDAAF
jgi:hypothetical protein